MTFAINSANKSGISGGIHQAISPKLASDSSFEKIFDSKVEKIIDQNKRQKTKDTKQKPFYDGKLEKVSSEISSNGGKTSKKDNVSKSVDERIENLKKIADKLKKKEDLGEDEFKELEEELEALIESLQGSETQLTNEQLVEFTTFLNEISDVFSEVEGMSEIEITQATNAENIEENTIKNKFVEDLQKNITKIEDIISKTSNVDSEKIPKEEFSAILSDISKDIKIIAENPQKIMEINPELLKETIKNTDNSSETLEKQNSDEIKVETELKSITISKKDKSGASSDSKNESKDLLSKTLVEVATQEEVATDKNVEILKFENTLIRSAKVDNPARAHAFEKNIMNQVVNHTTSHLNVLENGSEMILKLYPKNLGEVAVKLAIDKGVVLAEFNVESQAVKEVLESNLLDLKTALADKGFALEGLDVSVGDNGSSGSFSQNQKGSKSKNKFFEILEVEEDILNTNTSENSTTIDILK